MSTAEIPLPSVGGRGALETAALAITDITLRGASSETATLPERTASEITAVTTTGRSAAPPPRPPRGPSRRPSPPTPPAHQDRVPPIVTCICWNHRILPVSASANPRTKFLFVCFSGRILSISIFSQNPSWSKMKFPSWSKLFSCFGGCLPCSNCSTNVSCFGTITNNYGGQDDDLARNFTNKKESESQASASKQAALPDLISM
ncbi:hypothetical protein PVAP13_J041640 [Panicum virgatum]|nr:hypothetical protein PVAP13_J041640 [Panicum virgatum]